MQQPEENSAAKHLLGVLLVAAIGLTGLVLMFTETSATGQASRPGISDTTINRCNAGEVMLSARGIEALKNAGEAKYGPDFSPYSDAHVNYNGVGYCADADVVRGLLG